MGELQLITDDFQDFGTVISKNEDADANGKIRTQTFRPMLLKFKLILPGQHQIETVLQESKKQFYTLAAKYLTKLI